MKTRVFNKVMTELDTPVNENYELCLFLYKEHMLSTTYDSYDKELLRSGINSLNVFDGRRGNTHQPLVQDFLQFIGYK